MYFHILNREALWSKIWFAWTLTWKIIKQVCFSHCVPIVIVILYSQVKFYARATFVKNTAQIKHVFPGGEEMESLILDSVWLYQKWTCVDQWYIYICGIYKVYIFLFTIHTFIQGVSRLVNITAGGDFLGLCDQKS